MLLDVLSKFAGRRVVLASQSPRRVEILKKLGLEFDVIPSTFPENLDWRMFASPKEYVVENAKRKGDDVVARIKDEGDDVFVISADTVVVAEGVVLEKPSSKEDAIRMLTSLSGKSHYVCTGVVLTDVLTNAQHEFCEETTVTFGELPASLIEAYVGTGEPMDKAGAYGIQGVAGCFITGISGDYYNVMGLPLFQLGSKLRAMSASW